MQQLKNTSVSRRVWLITFFQQWSHIFRVQLQGSNTGKFFCCGNGLNIHWYSVYDELQVFVIHFNNFGPFPILNSRKIHFQGLWTIFNKLIKNNFSYIAFGYLCAYHFTSRLPLMFARNGTSSSLRFLEKRYVISALRIFKTTLPYFLMMGSEKECARKLYKKWKHQKTWVCREFTNACSF